MSHDFCAQGDDLYIVVLHALACVCHDIYTAHQCVEHDNVQVMAIGGQIVGDVVARELIDVFLNAKFSDSEEFQKRVAKLEEMDAR